MRFSSLEGKLALLLITATLVAAVSAALLTTWTGSALLGAAVAVAAWLLPVAWAVHASMQPIRRLLRALSGSVASYRDGDFSISLRTRRHDELGQLIEAHNELGHALREQRQNLVQRELLLDTVVQHSPTARRGTCSMTAKVRRACVLRICSRPAPKPCGRRSPPARTVCSASKWVKTRSISIYRGVTSGYKAARTSCTWCNG